MLKASSAQRPPDSEPGAGLHLEGNLLAPQARRDLADLNRQFLHLCLPPRFGEPAAFELPGESRTLLAALDPDATRALAECPLSLFEIRLPPEPMSLLRAGVADRPTVFNLAPAVAPETRTFFLLALAITQRIAAASPLAARIAFGMGPGDDARLAALKPSDLAALAHWHNLMRPRWLNHERYWRMLLAAARSGRTITLQWAYCVGLCLADGLPVPPVGAADHRHQRTDLRRATASRVAEPDAAHYPAQPCISTEAP